ncbi:MAG TPA: TlpA disulfide reductase family protein [Bacteroidales bacterium]|nr:TlpA disulfide reductase family protein [Bacteroidales bacterium]
MKISVTLLFSTILLIAACDLSKEPRPREFIAEGFIEGLDSGWIFLQYREQGNFITTDSLYSANGHFKFAGTLIYPRLKFLRAEGLSGNLTFFLEPGITNIRVKDGQLRTAEVTGSSSHDLLKRFRDEESKFTDSLSQLRTRYVEAKEAGNQELAMQFSELYEDIEREKKNFVHLFISENLNSVVSAHVALRNLSMLSIQQLESYSAGFEPSLAGSEYVQQLNERIAILNTVQIGKPAPIFTMNDTTGSSVVLNSLLGGYLLVDFWASWCPPCRAENPNKVEAYRIYHERGFDILSVSLDRRREDWIKAINDDQLAWNHVSDLKFWANDAAALYGVNSIPSNVLLNPDGIIIARNLKGSDLHKKLEELLGSQ